MTTKSKYLAAARSELNYAETPPGSNHTKFAAEAHHADHAAWCATFLVAIARRVGLKLPYYGAYTPDFASAFKRIGAYGKTPRVGAFGFIYFPSKGRIAHTFVVEAVHADGTFTTIEGNTDEKGGRTGGKVMRHRRSTANITFGYPVYDPEPAKAAPAKAPTKKPVAKKANPYAKPALTRARPGLSKGSRKTIDEVKYVQWAVGITGKNLDGVWGNQTDAKVKEFQAHRRAACGTDRAGTVGSKTLAEMVKIRR